MHSVSVRRDIVAKHLPSAPDATLSRDRAATPTDHPGFGGRPPGVVAAAREVVARCSDGASSEARPTAADHVRGDDAASAADESAV